MAAGESESITAFLITATQELVYNVIFSEQIEQDDVNIDNRISVYENFKRKFGYDAMEFFGLGNITKVDWINFLESSPGLIVDGERVLIDSENVLKDYNSRFLSSGTTVADYREKLLVRACLQKAERKSSDELGNTSLHLVAAMPGSGRDELSLLKNLLQSGVDPLQVNRNGLNFLHIIAGRLRGIENDKGFLEFGNDYVNKEFWETKQREHVLDVISHELSPAQLMELSKRPGRNGNTVIHEWVLSTSNSLLLEAFDVEELEIARTLLNFGGNLWLQNQSGLFPLHLASNSTVFKYLVEKGAVCRARNGQDETAVMFIFKYLIALAFVGTDVFKEIEGYLFKGNLNLDQCLPEAVAVLGHLITLVNEITDLQKTLWIPDIEDTTLLEMVLVAIRCASYYVDTTFLPDFSNLRSLRNIRDFLLALFHQIVKVASTQDLKRQNNKGQSMLHVLLEMKSNIIYDDSAIITTLQILLENGVDVNVVDANGQTVQDIVKTNSKKMPSFSKKCTEKLAENAQHGFSVSSVPRETIQATSALTITGRKRKLRASPRYHYETALRLTKTTENVTVVEKYRYFNDMPIGSGAFSSIYVAIKDEHIDQQTGTINCRAIALKRLEKGKIKPEEIQREVKALLSISTSCENIVNCYEVFEDEFFHYLSLDLMDGDLQHFIENTAAKKLMRHPGAPAKAVREIVNGLVFLHKRGYLHRDLKPGNILYTVEPSLHFKISDFGLAKNVSSLSMMTAVPVGGAAMAPGTRCWMAPELVSLHSREHTKQSDVFALGLVLHFLLTFGKHPFGSEEPSHVTEAKIVEMTAPVHGSVPSEASNFLQAILAKNPKNRPPVQYLAQHPFLWSNRKKMDFLKAVGDQREAVNPNLHANSFLEKLLERTKIAQHFQLVPWNHAFPELYSECTRAWRVKKYRTNSVIDLLRFIRNAYAHREERSPEMKRLLDSYIFLDVFPSLVMDVLGVVQKLKYDEERSSIKLALTTT